ncbi:hypothetical protein [Streptomyces sp. NPDC088146]|uniref:hypothetical protein n=1 Tax=Streptomyces sp. NPDC088146 TaxID=3365829 RepID=UPI00380C137B
MNNALRITAFAAALAATFGTAYGVGRGVDPLVAAEGRPAQRHTGHDEGKGSGAKAAAGGAAGGLQVSDRGYTLALETPTIRAGSRAEIRFAVKDDTGRKVTAYRREHGKELHFILASTDLNRPCAGIGAGCLRPPGERGRGTRRAHAPNRAHALNRARVTGNWQWRGPVGAAGAFVAPGIVDGPECESSERGVR